MTGRGVAVQGGLAALGLLAAYLTWQREPERAPGAVTVIDASKSDVTLIRYEDDSNAVDLTAAERQRGVWLHLVTKKKAEPKPDPTGQGRRQAAADAARAPRAICPAARARRRCSTSSRRSSSPRAFGVLDATKLKELGLDAPKRKLEVTVKGDVRKYEIGQPGNATAANRSCATRATGAST